jgi:hypothetical protein
MYGKLRRVEMKSFAEVFREERHYCSHLFRLLLELKESEPMQSGLYKVLDHLGVKEGLTEESIRTAEVYFEAAVFRDVYFASERKEELLESLYDALLDLLRDEYDLAGDPPPRPKELLSGAKNVHPRLLSGIAEGHGLNQSAVFYYRELSSLFSAKPDLLIVLPSTTLWVEAKFWESFESEQIERTKRIAALSETKVFQEFFGGKSGKLILLGSEKRHKKAQKLGDAFLSWEACSRIAEQLLPEHDDTREALKGMLSMK